MVLLDGSEHSYWELDEPRLRAQISFRETEFRQRKSGEHLLEFRFAKA